jgi:hypothetical protein
MWMGYSMIPKNSLGRWAVGSGFLLPTLGLHWALQFPVYYVTFIDVHHPLLNSGASVVSMDNNPNLGFTSPLQITELHKNNN